MESVIIGLELTGNVDRVDKSEPVMMASAVEPVVAVFHDGGNALGLVFTVGVDG